jgi:hypothetical protein
MIDVERVDYIRVPVTDIDTANHFYGEVLGLERNPTRPERTRSKTGDAQRDRCGKGVNSRSRAAAVHCAPRLLVKRKMRVAPIPCSGNLFPSGIRARLPGSLGRLATSPLRSHE